LQNGLALVRLGDAQHPGLSAHLVDDGNADGKITLGEIAQGKLKVTGTFDGDVQAFLPLTTSTDPAHHVDLTNYPNNLGSDAVVVTAGKLSNIGNVVYHRDPNPAPRGPTDPLVGETVPPTTPLDPSKLDSTRFVIYVHNLSTFLQSALSFDNLVNGLDQ